MPENLPLANSVILLRDVNSVQIPNGNTVTLKKGSEVVITQSLGGSFTVHEATHGGLFRIVGDDADALGVSATDAVPKPSGESLESRAWEVLKSCYDPEIPVNIVDLGLVYSMELSKVSAGHRIEIRMTLTAPGCGMGPSIAADARNKVLELDGVVEADVIVVWDPPWTPARMTTEGKARLGLEV